MPNSERETRNLRRAIGVLIVALCIVVHIRGLANGFVNYDDGRFITDNAVVQEGITWHGLGWAFTTNTEVYPIPLAWLTHMLDCQIYGLRPWGHHLTSILIHTANALLLFLILARMTRTLWPAALTAALFAVHPLHVESVAWMAERKDVLSAFFWMLTLGAYLRYARRPNVGRYLLVTILFVLGLMAKPMVMTLPAILLMLDYWPLGRVLEVRGDALAAPVKWRGIPRRCAWLIIEKIPLFALAIVDCIYSLILLKQSVGLASTEQRPFVARVFRAIVGYAMYLVKTVWPFDLCPFYPASEAIPPPWQIAGAALFLAAISALALFYWQRRPYLIVGWGWYLATLLPAIGLVQTPAGFNFSDRYTYLPLIGVFLMVAWALRKPGFAFGSKVNLPAVGSGVVLAALSIISIVQVGYWHDGVSLFTHALEAAGDNPVAHNNLGQALDGLGRKQEALVHYEKAANDSSYINPTVHNNLASAYTEAGRIDDAIRQYGIAIEIDPTCAETHNNLGVLLVKRGRFPEALAYYGQALRLDPGYVSAYLNLGGALARLGKPSEAAGYFQEAVRLAPDDFRTHYNLATAWGSLDRIDEAVSEYLKVIELSPENVDAYINLGVAKSIQGRFDEALIFYERALALAPGNIKALNDVATIRRTLQQKSFSGESER